MERIIRKYHLSSFFIITMVFSIVLFILHFIFPSAGNYSVSFTQLSPALTVGFISLVLNERNIIEKIKEKFFLNKSIIRWMIPAITIPFLLIAGSSMVLSFFNVEFVPWTGSFSFYTISFIAMLIGSTAEEIGWRGFLLPNLQKKHSPFVSSIIVGILWGVWHLNFTGGITGFLLYTITIIEMSILMTWLYNRTGGSLILMSLWHLTFNLSSHFFLWDRFGIQLFIVESILFGIACVILAVMEKYTHFFKRPLTEW